MKCILHTIKTFDFFGPQINFTIKGESSFKTVFGGLVSIIVYFLYLFFFVLFGKDMIFKLNPTTTLEYLMGDETENYTINNETFFAWRVTDFWGETYNYSEIFNYLISYEVFDNEKINVTDHNLINSVSCKGNFYENFFSGTIYNPEEWLCFDFRQLENKQIFGTFDSNIYSYLIFQLQICELDYENEIKTNCRDFKKMQEIINEENLQIQFLFHQVDFKANNYTDPLQRMNKTIYRNLNLNFQKTEYLKLRNIKVEQDDGILFADDVELTNMHGIFPMDDLTFFRNDDELEKIYSRELQKTAENVYTLCLFHDSFYDKYSRKYMKIQDVFGNVNGFMEFFTLIISVVTIYTDYRFDYYLFNKFVDVKFEESKNINLGHFTFSKNNEINYENINECKEFGTHRAANYFGSNVTGKVGVNVNLPKKDIELSKPGNSMNFDPSEFTNKDSSLIKINSGESGKINEASENKLYVHTDVNKLKRNLNESKGSIKEISLEPLSEKRFFNEDNKDSNLSSKIENDKIDELKENQKVPNNGVIFSNNNLINSRNNNKDEKDFVSKFMKSIDSNERYLKPSFCNYLGIQIYKFFNKKKFKKAEGKKHFDFKLMELYNDKINSKFDIFYYLKWVKNFKNIKEYLLESKINEKTFDSLAIQLYKIKIDDSFDKSILKTKGKIKINEQILAKFLEGLKESDNSRLKNYFTNKINELI